MSELPDSDSEPLRQKTSIKFPISNKSNQEKPSDDLQQSDNQDSVPDETISNNIQEPPDYGTVNVIYGNSEYTQKICEEKISIEKKSTDLDGEKMHERTTDDDLLNLEKQKIVESVPVLNITSPTSGIENSASDETVSNNVIEESSDDLNGERMKLELTDVNQNKSDDLLNLEKLEIDESVLGLNVGSPISNDNMLLSDKQDSMLNVIVSSNVNENIFGNVSVKGNSESYVKEKTSGSNKSINHQKQDDNELELSEQNPTPGATVFDNGHQQSSADNPTAGIDAVGLNTASSAAAEDVASKVYNILLLGETGVGKSTFLNAFINYIHFASLKEAMNAEEIYSIIPSRFVITDTEFNTHDITFGKPNRNENLKLGEPFTQSCKSYNFTFGDISLRFVDTPGVGDIKGIEADDSHLVNLIDHLAEIDYVNAILIMMKPNDSKLTVLFQYCVKRLLSCLDRSAAQNIIFLFTHSRGCFYRPGDVVQPLKIILNEIASTPPHIRIPFNATNVFCVDSETFRYLAAKRQGHEFDEAMVEDFEKSWEMSADTCDRLLIYITKLEKHSIENSVSVMEARKTIERLRWPLGKTIEHIEENIRRITGFQNEVEVCNAQISKFAKNLLFTRIMLNVRKLDEPRTVCTHRNCIELKPVEEGMEIHYKSVCHQPCTLKGVPREQVGDVMLKDCWVMTEGVCRRCKHSYLNHQHIYYETEPYIETILDEELQINCNVKEKERKSIKDDMQLLMKQKQRYEEEKATIMKAMAKFAHFLQNSAILPYNDAFEAYVRRLIEREKDMGSHARKNAIDNYVMLIKAYWEEVNVLKQALHELQKHNSRVETFVTAPEVMAIIADLYNLDLTGKYIRSMYEAELTFSLSFKEERHEQVIQLASKDSNQSKLSRIGQLYHKLKKKLLGTEDVEMSLEALTTINRKH